MRSFITSETNPFIKQLKTLLRSNRQCRQQGLTIAEGIHLGQELLNHSDLIVKTVVRSGAEKNPEISSLVQQYEAKQIAIIEVPASVFNLICPVETSVGLLSLIRIPKEDTSELAGDAVYLDSVQDPGNVGTIIRAVAASGVPTIYTNQDSAWIWSPKVLRSAMGAHFYIKIRSSVSLEEAKKETGAEILVADARGGKDLYQESWGERSSLWVFGNEGLGVSQTALDLADKVILIPIAPDIESLNVAMAATVCLFEQRRRRLVKK